MIWSSLKGGIAGHWLWACCESSGASSMQLARRAGIGGQHLVAAPTRLVSRPTPTVTSHWCAPLLNVRELWALLPCIHANGRLAHVEILPRELSQLDGCHSSITAAGMASLTQRSAATFSSAAEVLQTSAAAMKTAETAPSTAFGVLGRTFLKVLSVLPTILYWVTYTLPTWLFTLFSMSLTFTMNFTTL
jgi:hypothetical protein